MQNKAVTTLLSGRVSRVADGTGTVQLATGGDVFAGLQNYDSLLFLINVTDDGTATGALSIKIQDSWDSGTTWDDLVVSEAITLGSTSGAQRFFVQGRILSAVMTGTATTNVDQGSAPVSNMAAGSARQGPFGDRIRIQETVSGSGGSPVGATYTITMIPCRSENN
jgi:hypothetical protein